MNTEPFAERLPQAFLDLYCVELAAWWGGSRLPLRLKLKWPADLGRAEVSHATIKVVAGEVSGERRLCIVPASDEDDQAIGRNVFAWRPVELTPVEAPLGLLGLMQRIADERGLAGPDDWGDDR